MNRLIGATAASLEILWLRSEGGFFHPLDLPNDPSHERCAGGSSARGRLKVSGHRVGVWSRRIAARSATGVHERPTVTMYGVQCET